MSDRMSEDRIEWWRKYVPAEAMEELERARTREAELERENHAKARALMQLDELLQQAEVKSAELERALAQTQWMLRWTERDDALMNALVAKTEAEAKSAALERENERLRTALELCRRAFGNPGIVSEERHEARRALAALSPPKEINK